MYIYYSEHKTGNHDMAVRMHYHKYLVCFQGYLTKEGLCLRISHFSEKHSMMGASRAKKHDRPLDSSDARHSNGLRWAESRRPIVISQWLSLSLRLCLSHSGEVIF